MAHPLRIILVAREVWPFMTGGGIGRYVRDLARGLGERAEVTVLTSSSYRPRYEELRHGPAWPFPDSVRFAWAEDPDGDLSPMWSAMHAWSAACYRALGEILAGSGPQLVEFHDYGGPGTVTIDAKRAGDPALTGSVLAVRLHTSWELTQVLDVLPHDDLAGRTVMALERASLRFADLLLSPGGDTAGAYRRYYGADALAPQAVVPMPFEVAGEQPSGAPPEDGPLRLLFLGRMERRKGVHNLLRAVTALDRDDIQLTVVGGDTDSGPGGTSMRRHLEGLAGEDPRVDIRGPVPAEHVPVLIQNHHVVVVPSAFESFGYVAREAQAANRPALVTPVGGLVDAGGDGAGWVLPDTTEASLRDAIGALADRREEIDRLIAAGEPRTSILRRAAPDRLIAAYEELAERVTRGAKTGSPPTGRRTPISAIITAGPRDGDLEATVAALRDGPRPLEIVVVADRALRVPMSVVDRLSAVEVIDEDGFTLETGRRVAMSRRRFDGHVLLLRAGETVTKDFLELCAAGLDADPALPYVTTWAAGRQPVAVPLGNHAWPFLTDLEVAASVAMFAGPALADALQSTHDGGGDRTLYAVLADEGRFGAVFPERLAGVVHRTRGHDPRAGGRALAATGAPRQLWEARNEA